MVCNWYLVLPWWLSGKESACQCRRRGFNPWVGKIPWTRNWQPSLIFLPGKSHGQRSLAGYSTWGCKRVGHNWATEQQVYSAFRHFIFLTDNLYPSVQWKFTEKDQSGPKGQGTADCKQLFSSLCAFRITILLLTLGWAGLCGSHQPHFLPNCLLSTRPYWPPFWKWPAFPHPGD